MDIFSALDEVTGGDLKDVFVTIGKKDFKLLMQEDTGASCTIISSHMWKSLNCPNLKKYKGKALRSYDGSALKIMGTLEILINYRNHYELQQVRVVRSDKSFGLLGRDVLAHHMHSVEVDKTQPNQLGCI